MIHHLLQQLTLWTFEHPAWAGIVLFLISIAETITVFGSIIPGSFIMIAVGILIGAGLLPYTPIVLWAAAGALLGDSLNFTLGYYLKDNLRRIWPFSVRQHWLDKGKKFFAQHGRKSVFLGRFFGPLRAFVPVTAGALHMPVTRFVIIDALSALLWAGTYVLPGIVLGAASLSLPPDIASHFMLFVFLGLIIVAVIIWLMRLFYLHISEVLKHALSCLWQFMQKTPGLRRPCAMFRHYKQDHPRGQLTALVMWCVLMICFLLLCYQVVNHVGLVKFNPPIFHFITSIRTHAIDQLMIYISSFGQKRAISIVFVLIFIWFCYLRCWRAALYWLALTILTYASIYLIQHIIPSPRPTGFKHSFSFPSGHVTLATVLYGGIAYFVASRWPEKARWLCYLVASVLIVFVGISRVYLGAHWLTDVIGAVLLGAICLITVIFLYQRHATQRIKPNGLLIIAISSIVLSTGIDTYATLNNTLARIRAHEHSIAIEQLTDWWQQDGKTITSTLDNRFGWPQTRANIQWAGTATSIVQTLAQQGWHELKAQNWATAIQHPKHSHQYHMYFKTLLYRDQMPEIIVIKTINQGKTTLLLRMWPTQYYFIHPPKQLWLGLLTRHDNPKNNKLENNRPGYKNINKHQSRTNQQKLVLQTNPEARYLLESALLDQPTKTVTQATQQVLLIGPKN